MEPGEHNKGVHWKKSKGNEEEVHALWEQEQTSEERRGEGGGEQGLR